MWESHTNQRCWKGGLKPQMCKLQQRKTSQELSPSPPSQDPILGQNSPHGDVLRNMLTFSPQDACLPMIPLELQEGAWHWFPSNMHVKTCNLGVT